MRPFEKLYLAAIASAIDCHRAWQGARIRGTNSPTDAEARRWFAAADAARRMRNAALKDARTIRNKMEGK